MSVNGAPQMAAHAERFNPDHDFICMSFSSLPVFHERDRTNQLFPSRFNVHHPDVNILAADGLMAMHGQRVLPGFKRRLRLFVYRMSLVLRGIAVNFQYDSAIQIQFSVFVVVHGELRIAQFEIRRQLKRSAQPDVRSIPFGPDNCARRAARTEAARPLSPGRIIEVGRKPTIRRFLNRVTPIDALLLRRGSNLFNDRRRWRWGVEFAIRRRNAVSIHLDERAVVGHQAVDLDFDVGCLRVNRRRQSRRADERVRAGRYRDRDRRRKSASLADTVH